MPLDSVGPGRRGWRSGPTPRRAVPDTSGPEQVGSDGPPVGRVAGTEDSTPLQFSVALDQDAYLQLDDVVVTVRAVPGRRGGAPPPGVVTEVRARHEGATYGSDVFLDRRRRAARAGAGDRRGHHHPRRAGGATCRRGPARSPPGHRRGARARRCTSTRWSARSPVGLGRDGDPDLPEPGVPRRHPRRPRVDQRDLRRRDQDQLRAVPAATRSSPSACSASAR